MDGRYKECEALVGKFDKKDCADYRHLGWSKSEWHTHERGQLIYAEYGVMRLYAGEDVYYIPSWHAAWIPMGMRHMVVTESQDLLFYTLYLDCTGLTDPFYSEISIFPVSHMLREMIVYTKRWPLRGEAGFHEGNFLATIKYLLPEYAHKKRLLRIPLPVDKTLFAITAYIQENIGERVTTSTLTRKFGISERSMHRLFLKDMGMSFIQFQKLMRIIRAVELLSIPGKNVSEVAYEVGYQSIPSFTRTFREIMGESPSRLLRQNETAKEQA